ncbi:MAG: ATP-binding protein [Nitrospirae bacterium]|nr:MAG: ATP-binding protein [Nitrospirota bacterium]
MSESRERSDNPAPHADSRADHSHLGEGIDHIIAISSGKGGVGKTTVAVNLAVALAKSGANVGLMDADIYGPNVPGMLGVTTPPHKEGDTLIPPVSHGVKVMSMGFFVPEETPVVWRGPMVHGAIQQFFRDVVWGKLDYLLVDLPPGTGDVPLSLSQMVPLTGAITVTTPQEVALHDVRKGIMMFKKVNVPVLGIIENMSYYVCAHCGQRAEIFDYGGGERAAEKYGIPFLGRIPLDPAIRIGGDIGAPIVIAHPDSPQAKAFEAIAAKLMDQLSKKKEQAGSPSIADMIKKIKEPMTPKTE